MIRNTSIASILLAALASAGSPPAPEDPALAGFRNLAADMLKSRTAGSDSAYCEYAPVSQVDGCSGPNRNALRYRICRKGSLEAWSYRSPRQKGTPVGYYRGRIDEAQWKAMLKTFAAMRWTENPAGPPGPPLPPGPAETISILTLSDGKKKADYGKSGPAPDPVSAAFAQPGILARNTTDTVWQLSLVNPKAEVRKDSVWVTAEWKWRGPAGSRALFSQEAGGEFCGNALFKWYVDTADFAVEWQEGSASVPKGKGSGWDLPGAKPSALRLAFPFTGSKVKPMAKRIGVLDGIGIRLVAAGSRDTVSATVYTDPFEF